MEEDVKKIFEELQREIKVVFETVNARINKLREVIFNYLEAGSSIALSSVKANLKSV